MNRKQNLLEVTIVTCLKLWTRDIQQSLTMVVCGRSVPVAGRTLTLSPSNPSTRLHTMYRGVCALLATTTSPVRMRVTEAAALAV